MIRRTTVEIDEDLLARAKVALSVKTTRAAIEEALRRATESAEAELEQRSTRQKAYLERLSTRIDAEALGSGEMWR